MKFRAALVLLLLAIAPGVGGCASAPDAEIRQILAPTGALRVALYTGTPTSILSQSDRRGVGHDLGQALARRMGVPFQPLVFTRNTDVLAAMKTAKADIAFTNPSPARTTDMDFTQVYLRIELGYLVSPKSAIASLAAVDQPGVRVGVTANSSSDATLTRDLKNAQVVRGANYDAIIQLMSAGAIDVYATNKAALFAVAESLKGARVLDGNWGAEPQALAIPKNRERGLPYVRAFIADVAASGAVQAAVDKAQLRGAVVVQSAP